MAKDPRAVAFEYAHKRVFEDNAWPSIPHGMLREYLDYLIELRRADQGKMPFLPGMSINDIKQRGARLYQEEKDRTQ